MHKEVQIKREECLLDIIQFRILSSCLLSEHITTLYRRTATTAGGEQRD
jgi:hypothetical protein